MAYGTRKFITTVTNVRPGQHQASFHHEHLLIEDQRRLGLPNDLLPYGFQPRIEHLSLSPIRAAWPSHLLS